MRQEQRRRNDGAPSVVDSEADEGRLIVKLVISADHAGFPLKEEVHAYLTRAGHEVLDLGAFKLEPQDDYPDFAEKSSPKPNGL